jgi:hypothetical protein
MLSKEDDKKPITQKFLFQVAFSCRLQLEKGSIDKPVLNRIKTRYREFFDRPDVDQFVDFLVKEFPRHGDTLGTLYVKEVFGDGEVIRDGFYEVDGEKIAHSFLLVEGKDGRVVVDIAADQFDGPAIHVGVLQHPWSMGEG